MKRVVLMVAVSLLLTGCRWGDKPYARDPLVKKKQTVPGELRAMPKLCETDHPAPPGPPTEERAAPP